MIEIKVQGDFFLSVAKELITEAAQIATEHDCFLVLNDMRGATVKLSMLEIYELPKTLRNIFASLGLNVHKLRQALVVKKDLKDFDFYETVTVNRSQHVKYFLDMNEARKWLFEK